MTALLWRLALIKVLIASKIDEMLGRQRLPDFASDPSKTFAIRALAQSITAHFTGTASLKPVYRWAEICSACVAAGAHHSDLRYAIAMFGIAGNQFGSPRAGSLLALREFLAHRLGSGEISRTPTGYDFHSTSILLYSPKENDGEGFRGGGYTLADTVV